jgi:hypothetical protein
MNAPGGLRMRLLPIRSIFLAFAAIVPAFVPAFIPVMLPVAALADQPTQPAQQPSEQQASDSDAPAATVSRKPHIRFGGFTVGAAYSRGFPGFYSPYYGAYPYDAAAYPGRFWGLYDPYWYSPYLHPGLYTGFPYGPNMGEVKLQAKSKAASVYIDGAFAGTAEKLKHFWLEPGVYNLEVKDGSTSFQQRVYVLSGKTLTVIPAVQAAMERKP